MVQALVPLDQEPQHLDVAQLQGGFETPPPSESGLTQKENQLPFWTGAQK